MKILHNCPHIYEKFVMKLGSAPQAQAFTFSPPHCDYIWDLEKIHKELCFALTGYRYILVGEFDSTNRWHYHGIVVSVPINVFKTTNQALGFFDFAGAPSIKWLEYMFKHINATMKNLDTVEYCVYQPMDFRLKGIRSTYFEKEVPAKQVDPGTQGSEDEPHSLKVSESELSVPN